MSNNSERILANNAKIEKLTALVKTRQADKLIVDTAMSDTSTNAVQNKVIKGYVDTKVSDITATQIRNKEPNLVVSATESTPKQNSNNLITSGGVYSAINAITPTYQKTDSGVTVIRIGSYLKMSRTFSVTGNTEQTWNFPLQFDTTPLCWCNSSASAESANNSCAVKSCNNLSMTVRVCGVNSTVTMFAEGIKSN